MNLQKYIYMTLVVMGIAACTKEVVVEIPVIPEPAKTNVTFGLRTSLFTTRATDDHYGTEPTLEERRVFNYAILIFNAAQQLEAALTASPYDPADPASEGVEYSGPLQFLDENGEDKVLELTTGVKYLFALVNAPQPLLEARDELIYRGNSTLQDFTDWILNVGDHGGLGLITGTTAVPADKERGFMMTSEDGITRVTLEPSLGGEETQKVILTVGRAMAKVSVASDLTPDQQPNGELTDISYKVVNNPYEMYVVPSIINKVLITPYSQKATENSTAGNYFESPGQMADNFTPVSRKNALTRVYCMEHAVTQSGEQPVTTAIVKGTYVPHILYKANGTDLFTDYKKGDHFWRIATIQDGERISYDEKYYGEDPSDYLEENQQAIPYPEGQTWYAFYLRNENSATPYTVKRNSYYTIDITRVNHAGEEGEGSIDPGDPGDPNPPPVPPPTPQPDLRPVIEVSIRITDWQGIHHGGNL